MRLYGKRSVLERLRAAPETIRALYLQQNTDASDLVRTAQSAKRPFKSLPKLAFANLAGSLHAQGVLAEVEEFRYTPLEKLLRKDPRLTLFFLDRLTDPQNLGNILRSLACLGGMGIVLPKHESVDVNETVLRVASGAENYVPVAQVTNLIPASQAAKEVGYWIAGAAASGGQPVQTVNLPSPLAIVIGSEGSGIRPGLNKHLDLTVTLPMRGAALSFNTATAAALIAYEIVRRGG